MKTAETAQYHCCASFSSGWPAAERGERSRRFVRWQVPMLCRRRPTSDIPCMSQYMMTILLAKHGNETETSTSRHRTGRWRVHRWTIFVDEVGERKWHVVVGNVDRKVFNSPTDYDGFVSSHLVRKLLRRPAVRLLLFSCSRLTVQRCVVVSCVR